MIGMALCTAVIAAGVVIVAIVASARATPPDNESGIAACLRRLSR